MSTTSNVTSATRGTQPAVDKNIVDTAAANGSFKIFGDALNRSGVADSLKGEGPFTMFAPTDDAFEQLPQGQLDTWLKPENKDELAAVMRYHVLQGRSSATEIGKLKQAKTLQGQSVQIMIQEGKISVGDAELTAPDLASGNGVVHGIDKVNVPTKQ
jgi:uncharacterized surface protein with fasciclin (FAS1) repeats